MKEAVTAGTQICLVIGGGNIFRGMAGAAKGIDRATADYMGMLATVMNALAMQAAPGTRGRAYPRAVRHSHESVCEPYIRRRAIRHMEKGRVVIFAAGTGNPFFTTDTAAALRAAEMNCDAMLKGDAGRRRLQRLTRRKFPDAKRFDILKLSRGVSRAIFR